MQDPSQHDNSQESKRPHSDWNGLGNKPRNENLAKIRVGSFEKQKNHAEKETVSGSLYPFKKNRKIRRK